MSDRLFWTILGNSTRFWQIWTIFGQNRLSELVYNVLSYCKVVAMFLILFKAKVTVKNSYTNLERYRCIFWFLDLPGADLEGLPPYRQTLISSTNGRFGLKKWCKNTKNVSKHRKNIDFCPKVYNNHVILSYKSHACHFRWFSVIFDDFGVFFILVRKAKALLKMDLY